MQPSHRAFSTARRVHPPLDHVRHHHQRAQGDEDERHGGLEDREENAAERDRREQRQQLETRRALGLGQLRRLKRLDRIAAGDHGRPVERRACGMGWPRRRWSAHKLDAEHRLADPQPVSRQPRAPGDRLVVQRDPVGRAQVEDLGRTGREEEPDVAAGHEPVRQHQVAAVTPADRDVSPGERNALPGVRPLKDGHLSHQPGGTVGILVSGRGDGDAVARFDAAVGGRERGIQGDTLAIEHGQRDGASRDGTAAAGREPRRATFPAVGVPDGERRGDIPDRRVGRGCQHQVGRSLGTFQRDLELHRYAPPGIAPPRPWPRALRAPPE